MKQILYIFTFLFSYSAFGQTCYVKSKIVDINSNKGIPYSNIWILNKNSGTSSSVNGDFIMETDSNAISTEKLKITAIGYYDTVVNISDIPDEIYLMPREYKIDEIIINPQKKNTLILNPITKKMDKTFWICSNRPSIICRYFKNNEVNTETNFIKSIIVYTEKSIKKHDFNVHVYEYDTINKKPGDELINDNILVTTESKFGFGFTENIIDVSQFNLQFPNSGVLVGLEWIMTKENRYDETISGVKIQYKEKKYGPDFLVTYENENITWMYARGYWFHKEISFSKNICPAISLILTD